MARFLNRKGLLIQHIPRTGGTWVEEIICHCRVPHYRWLQVQPDYLPSKHCALSHYNRDAMVQVKMTAAFVRHPISYYESCYKWMYFAETKLMRYRWKWHPHMAAARWFKAAPVNFNDWVYLMLEKEPCWYTRLIEMYVGPPGGEFIDYIGRTESLRQDFINLMIMVGYVGVVEKNKEFIMSAPKANTRELEIEWDHSLRDRVEKTEFLITERFYGENSQRRRYARLVANQIEIVAACRRSARKK